MEKKLKGLKIIFTVIKFVFFPITLLFIYALRCRNGEESMAELKKYRYAHRGLHMKPEIPENSMAAFKRAIEYGFGAELDIHLTKDGRLAVIHDSSLLRTAGADVKVEDLTAEEVKSYRLEGTDETIPFFEEVLELFEGKTPLIVELKPTDKNNNALAEAACEMLDRYNVSYCIESFDPRCLNWLRINRPEIIRGQLSWDYAGHKEDTGHSKLVTYLLTNLYSNLIVQPDFVAYCFEDRNFLNLKLCRKIYHVQEVNWTIRKEEDMKKAEELGNIVIFEKFIP